MIAIFWEFGIIAVDKERLTISVISGSNLSMHTFTNYVGIGSNSHVVFSDLSNIDFIYASVAGVKMTFLLCTFLLYHQCLYYFPETV